MKDASGEVTELHADWDPGVVGRQRARRAHGARARCTGCRRRTPLPTEVRLYDRLFSVENPGTDERQSFLDEINPDSVVTHRRARCAEPYLGDGAKPGTRVQFERVGYFCLDPDSTPGKPIWNRTVGLKDSWAKIENEGARQGEAGARAEGAEAEAQGRRPSPRRRPPRSPSTISARSTCASAW